MLCVYALNCWVICSTTYLWNLRTRVTKHRNIYEIVVTYLDRYSIFINVSENRWWRSMKQTLNQYFFLFTVSSRSLSSRLFDMWLLHCFPSKWVGFIGRRMYITIRKYTQPKTHYWEPWTNIYIQFIKLVTITNNWLANYIILYN